MNERKQRILQAIIEDYVKSAEPVGSRTISRNYNIGISPATVRNEMSDLEEEGYLEQPHASAGRIPSAKAYRLYVDSMIQAQPVPKEDAERINHVWHDSLESRNDVFLSMAKMISQVSHSMSLFLAPVHDRALLKYIHALPLDAHQAVMVVITGTGALDNEPMYFKEPVAIDVLQTTAVKFSNALQDIFIRDITPHRLAQLVVDIEGPQNMVIIFCETLHRAITKRKLFYSVGAKELLMQPEFKSVEKVQPILSLVEEQDQLSQLLIDESSNPVKVSIGIEHKMESLHDLSVVQADFSTPGQNLGTLAILGPTRMEYSRIIGMLTYMKQLMDAMAKDQDK